MNGVSVLIDSKKRLGKFTYIDEISEYGKTNTFKICKSNLNKILNLAEKGTETNERNNDEIYTVYEIKINNKITFVDSILDKENILLDLFKKIYT